MTKKTESTADELRPEYTADVLRNPVRGKYLSRYQSGTNVVLLAPDVFAAFPSEEAVNEALRSIMKSTNREVGSIP